jgi:hypothetical protein
LSGHQTNDGNLDVYLLRRSTANSGGTSTATTAVSWDSTNVAATAAALSYTANPTAGTLVGNLDAQYIFVPALAKTAGGIYYFPSNIDPTEQQDIVLRGAGEVLAINFNGVTVTGGTFNCTFQWTAE